MAPADSLGALDRAHVFHPYTSIAAQQAGAPRLWAEGKGVWVRDAAGREVLDAMAGLWCVAAGYGRDEIAEAMAEQARRLAYMHGFLGNANEPAIRLAARLAALTPPGLDRAFFCNSGSEANDTVIKLVWYHWNLRGRPEKKKIVSRHGGYHGVTLGATSLSGLPYMHALFDAPLERFVHVRKPHLYREGRPGESESEFAARLADELDATIRAEGPDTVAAFVGEPLMGAGGVIPPPAGYWEAVQEVLRRHEVLLVADEVICGFGRLGTAFGSQRYGIAPDLMTVAKGLTSAYFPVSAAVVSERVWQVLADGSAEHGPVAHGHTTSLHPVGAAAALANLDILEREGLLERAARVGPGFQRRLREAVGDHPWVGEVRGEGLIAAVELVADRATREPLPPEQRTGLRLHELLLEEGLVCRALGDSLAFSPPLCIGEDELEEAVRRFARGLDRLAGA
ncbi:MAG: aminotransferase [Myxococcota bacterium]|nr:aminotransferase [Myxococcota bacterium]